MAAVFGDNSAYAQTIFAYQTNSHSSAQLFVGQTKGFVVQPRGKATFGWDACFQPEGHELTYAEMSSTQKNIISHRSKALQKFITFLKIS